MLKLIVFIGKWTQPTVFKPSEEHEEKKKKKGREKNDQNIVPTPSDEQEKANTKLLSLNLEKRGGKGGGDGADKTQVGRTKRTSVRRTT